MKYFIRAILELDVLDETALKNMLTTMKTFSDNNSGVINFAIRTTEYD